MKESRQSGQSVKFGTFEADFTARELRKNGVKVRLQDQPFQVLELLLQNPGELITREVLRRKLWPADTFVDFDNGLNTAINKIREALGDSAENPRFIETLPRRGYRLVSSLNGTAEVVTKRPGAIDSIAVFPFANTSADPDTEYLALGIPGSIIHSLSQIPDLRVIAWSAVSGYKDREMTLQPPAAQFNARAILLGRIWQRGNRLRLQVDLVDSATGEEIWGDQYDRDVTEIFSLQDEISCEVSQKLRLKLTGEQAARLTRRHTENIEAYQLYLRGRRNNEKRSTDGFKTAAGCLTEAIRKDPNYALAYAELAQCILMPAYYGLVSPHEAYPKAKALALKALEMDDTLTEAREALATVMQNYDYDWTGAEKEYKRAIELNPNYPVARLHYSMHLAFRGRSEDAIREASEGQRRDPMSGVINAGVSFALACARQFDLCIEQSLISIEVDPYMSFTYASLGMAYEGKRMFAEAIATHEKILTLGGSSALHLALGAHSYAEYGEAAKAREMLCELQRISWQNYIPWWSMAIVHEGLGEIDLAIEALQKALENRESLLVSIKALPQFDKLRDDPRFQEIERRVGLPS